MPLRPLALALALLSTLCGGQAKAQATLPIALAQQVNANGQPLAGCLVFFYVTGTVATPQTAYSDTALTKPLPWPLQCDQNGRVPAFYLSGSSIHVRLTDSGGNAQFDYPNALLIGASGGGGGSSTNIDPTTIAATGDVKFRLTSETLTGWVVLNGQTIGSALSGASSRANNDTQNLFVYLWTNCTNAHCPVSTGRGATAIADFNANKTIQLFDMRDRLPVGRDCMGNSCAGGLLAGNVTSGGGDGVDTPGASGGAANTTLAVANLPNPTFTNSGITVGRGTLASTFPTCQSGGCTAGGSNLIIFSPNFTTTFSFPTNAFTGSPAVTAQGTSSCGAACTDSPFANMNPFALGTWYQKL